MTAQPGPEATHHPQKGAFMFIDRERELNMLEERYSSEQAELFVLYADLPLR